jgi:hypothetical protein
LRVAVTTVDASIAASENLGIYQNIEGFNARDLIGKTFTLSFWVRSSKVGTHCVSLRNTGGDRTYVAEYAVGAANTWEQKFITVNGGLITAGTWSWTTALGVSVGFSLACGTTFQTTPNAWQTGNFFATSNQVNCLDTIGNIFAITGVQLEVGSVATPFEHRNYGQELALCQRYFQSSITKLTTYSTAAQSFDYRSNFPVVMRAAPTIVSSFTYSNASSGITAAAADGCLHVAAAVATGNASFTNTYTASAEL